ncbi:MAG TPA: 3-dehydroquinate synthase [Saprospiraceae bacterium]|nr:3-dehydroquinate synthase [Saprospiraceae bacterium]HMP25376.1 3-dehydroquinate synthase [Saprospiraceae bacterium]
MDTIQLNDYNIYIGDVAQSLPKFLQTQRYSRIFVLCDDNTEQHCLPRLEASLDTKDWTLIKIPPGEQHKHIETCKFIWWQMMEQGADRQALLLNLGGGVIGDMGGFCAATYKRGVDFVQIPTTLLAQVDASIGGKLAIDFMEIKNSIGVFRNPQAVLIDPLFLKTLSGRERRSGFAEIIKHSLIADKLQWRSIRNLTGLSDADWQTFIPLSLYVKKRIVEEDPYERGIRKALNFGHTIGHALESLMLETVSPLLHGEAIAIGMICESWLSHRLLGLPVADLNDITNFILRIFGHHPVSETDFPRLLQLMQNDKKNEAGHILFSLVHPLGQAAVNQTADAEIIFESLRYYNRLVASKTTES